MLRENWFGFRKKVLNSNAFIDTLYYIYENLESGHSVITVFLDFAKAFDSVNHELLLQKMSTYAMRGGALDWFCSYLTQ